MEDLLEILVLPLLGAIEMIINRVIRFSLEDQLLLLLPQINLLQHHRQQPLQTKFKISIVLFTRTLTSNHLIEMLKTHHTMPVFQTLKQI